jgi:ankyrin repeat protein
MLEKRGADANYVDTKQCTPLIAASGGGHVPVVEALIAAGSKVEYARREDGCNSSLRSL